MIIASCYGLEGPGSNPGWDEVFRAIQTDSGAFLSYIMVTECFPGA